LGKEIDDMMGKEDGSTACRIEFLETRRLLSTSVTTVCLDAPVTPADMQGSIIVLPVGPTWREPVVVSPDPGAGDGTTTQASDAVPSQIILFTDTEFLAPGAVSDPMTLQLLD